MRVIITLIGILLLSTGYIFAAPSSVDQSEKTYLSFQELPEFRISGGELLYKRYCLFCHGESGAGDGMNAYNLPVKPANFLNDEFRAKTVRQLAATVLGSGAVPGGDKTMPTFGATLSPQNITALIIYLQNLDSTAATLTIEDESDEL